MVRHPLSEQERERGAALGRVLQQARGDRSAAEIAGRAGISLDTLRKIERGAIAAPTFFTVAALARVLDLDLTSIADRLHEPRLAGARSLDALVRKSAGRFTHTVQ